MAHIAIIGPGAVGSVFATLVGEDGTHTLSVCARSGRPEKIVVDSDGRTRVCIPDDVLTDPGQVDRAADWIFLSVKTHQTAGAAGWLQRLCSRDTTVLVLQNGICHEARVAPYTRSAVVLPAIVWCPSEVIGDGRVRLRGPVRIGVPSNSAGERLADLLDPTESEVKLVDDFTTHAWRKLCTNVVAGLMAITGRRAEVYSVPGMMELAYRLACESAAVGRTDGADFDVEVVARDIVAELTSMPPDMGTSMLFDRLGGREIEWREIQGVVQRLGRKNGVPTPALDALVPLLHAVSRR